MKTNWLIYGANGYSAQLAAEKAVKSGLRPILAGRNIEAIDAIAKRLGLESRIFDLSNINFIMAQLEDIKVVSHCAGPYSATAEPMMNACINTGTHYTDITGEIEVFEFAQTLNDKAKSKDSVLCNGVGFDVIPTDCMTNFLQQALPDATHLTLGFQGNAALSPGTAKTMAEGISQGMKVRRNGKLTSVKRSFEMREIDYGRGIRQSVILPWGDLSTAYWQTKIPNITVYTPFKGSKLGIYLFPLIQTLMKSKKIQNFAKRMIENKIQGPDEASLKSMRTYVWGEVKNDAGKTVSARIQVPGGYTVTVDGIILTAKFLLDYTGPGGCLTPSQLMGHELAEQLPGADKFEVIAA